MKFFQARGANPKRKAVSPTMTALCIGPVANHGRLLAAENTPFALTVDGSGMRIVPLYRKS